MDWTGSVTSDDTEKGSGNIDITLDRVSTLIEVLALKDRHILWADEET